jgi:hypothetical protein
MHMPRRENKRTMDDLLGLGKLAKAIPPKVYERTADAVLKTFQQLIAPLTETTSGAGRYIHQRFDSWIDAQKALAAYTLEEALHRARDRARQRGGAIVRPSHPKSFIKTLEEASEETEPLLHEMWTNLLASQLVDTTWHPHFIQLLPHFSPAEARLLLDLLPVTEIGDHGGDYLGTPVYEYFKSWARRADAPLQPWTLSCTLLCEWRLADARAFKGTSAPSDATILFRTQLGAAFVAAVTEAPESRVVDAAIG